MPNPADGIVNALNFPQRLQNALPSWLQQMLGLGLPMPGQGSSTDRGQLPPEWQKANEESLQQQMGQPVAPPTRRVIPTRSMR